MRMSHSLPALVLITLSTSAFAVERDVEIECKLNVSQSAVVERVRLYFMTDEIKIDYRDGSAETVKPVDAKNDGLFGTDDFSKDLVWNNGQVFAPSTAAGPLYVRFGCYLTPTIFFERCISQGTGDPANFAGVRMNLNGKALAFFDDNICARTDRSPL